MTISDYHKTLPTLLKPVFRNEVMKKLGMKQTTFYYKVSHGNWTLAEQTLIKPIIQSIENARKH